MPKFKRPAFEGFDEYIHYDLPDLDGFSVRYRFPNGKAVSIVQHIGVFCSRQGLMEAGVFDENRDLEVIPGLTEEECIDLLHKVSGIERTRGTN